MNKKSTDDFQGSETTLHNTVMVDTDHNTLAQTHGRMYNTKSEANVNYRRCRFIGCNKCNTPMWNVDHGGDYA